jgi:hypothetical protein
MSAQANPTKTLVTTAMKYAPALKKFEMRPVWEPDLQFPQPASRFSSYFD